MITGVGIDIVQVKRMESWIDNPNLMERYFHPDELTAAFLRGKNAAQSFAARFAAKEAFGKALGTGLADISLKDIMVYNNNKGKPELKLFGSAQQAFLSANAVKAHISLSHESENAIAMVILEGR